MTGVSDTDSARSRSSRLAEEQASLRRVATLVAQGVTAAELFAGVAVEVSRVLDLRDVLIERFGDDRTTTVVASLDQGGFPLGSRWPLDGPGTSAAVFETGRPARIDDYTNLPGTIAAYVRDSPMRSSVGAPIVVDGSVWGVICVSARNDQALPADTEERLTEFTELVATAIANTEARDGMRRLADEQAALRRVATLVAQGTDSTTVFDAVCEETGRLIGAASVNLSHYTRDGFNVTVAGWSERETHIAVGTRFPLTPDTIGGKIVETSAPVRIDSWEDATSELGKLVRGRGIRSSVGAPVVVEGELWGALVAATDRAETLPTETGSRLGTFAELIATAISEAEARESLRRLADEQAALRRVAVLVAEGASTATLAAAVVEEIVGVVGVPAAWLIRYDPDRIATVVALFNDTGFPVGSRWPLEEGSSVVDAVFDTGRAARVDDFSAPTGPIATRMRDAGFTSAVAVPIIVNRTVWGAVRVATREPEPLPADTVDRLSEFTELVATAVLNAESRDGIRGLANEQAALRRVATLVAESAAPDDLFSAVAVEVRQLLDVSGVVLDRYDAVGTSITTLALELEPGWTTGQLGLYVGANFPLEPGSLCAAVYGTGQAARINDYSDLVGVNGDAARKSEVGSSCGTPIVVDGRLWGTMSAFSRLGTTLPEGTEHRLREFTEILATALSNIDARDEQRRLAAELIASRKRIIAAGDEARRRIERNLHDGTQQRLIALGFDLQRVRAALADDQRDAQTALESVEQDLESVLEEVRDLSRGLHPPLLSRRGLGPSVAALARRSPIPIDVQIDIPERPREALEIAAYYVVSEALTNAVRHSQATSISIRVVSDSERLQAVIADDGVGGAKPAPGSGSGLIGLVDRVDALGGRIVVESPAGRGTTISIELPTKGA